MGEIVKMNSVDADPKKENLTANSPFVFNAENFRNPLSHFPSKQLEVIDVPVTIVSSDKDLEGYGKLVDDPINFTVENDNFEIVKWPLKGWRNLDPNTGDEGGTVEGNFEVNWKGDFYYGKNLAIVTDNNTYLDGLGTKDWKRANEKARIEQGSENIYLWMSDYHPDGGQLFFPKDAKIPFFVCLGQSKYGDDIKPEHMRGFYIPAGKGVYIHPGTWHNGIYVERNHTPATFFTRQGRVHARVSCSWVQEFGSILRLPLQMKKSTL